MNYCPAKIRPNIEAFFVNRKGGAVVNALVVGTPSQVGSAARNAIIEATKRWAAASKR